VWPDDFIVDEQLPAALARWLVAKGHAAQHVTDLKMQSVPDTVIWDYAVKIGAVIVTKDEDFAPRHLLAQNGPPIIWIRLPNTRRQVTGAEPVAKEIARSEATRRSRLLDGRGAARLAMTKVTPSAQQPNK